MKILWVDETEYYWVQDGKLQKESLLFYHTENEEERILFLNELSNSMSVNGNMSLYCTIDMLGRYIQIVQFSKLLKNVNAVLLEKGLDDYIMSNGVEWVQQVIGKDVAKMIQRIQDLGNKFAYKEIRKTYGTLYPNKTFFVIRLRPITSSWGGIMPWILKQLYYMEKKNKDYIPVIDLSCFWNIILSSLLCFLYSPSIMRQMLF